PHVFAESGASDVETADDVVAQWEAIKDREKRAAPAGAGRALAGVPAGMPALARAQKLSSRAARVGFDWPDVAGCRVKVAEELEELDHAVASGDGARVEAELGDLLFATVSLARKLGCDAEEAL